MTYRDLIKRLAAEESPCNKFDCELRDQCASERLACQAFVVYVSTGRARNPRFRWIDHLDFGYKEPFEEPVPKPTAELFASLDDDRAPKSDEAKLEAENRRAELVNKTISDGIASKHPLQTAWSL